MKRLFPATLTVLFSFALLLAVRAALSQPPAALTVNTGQHFLPPYPNVRDRFGFDSDSGDPLTNYDVAALHAGWYSDWGANLYPAHPDDLTYVQLIRFKAGSDPHDPTQVSVSPGRATIAQIAAAHPGSLWMISNEPDSLYQGNPIYPDVYAQVYHEYYEYIKGLDPTALIANGGIVQPTPCRLAYLDIVWDTYYNVYSETWPVDVWNIHAFILREVYGSWGASTPPGVPHSCGIDYKIRDGDNINIFRDNLISFRQWMRDKGEQNKPLIISEYGILWPDWLKDEDGNGFPPSRVSHFMTQTFDLFLNETYRDVGYPADDYRLVQAWAWYSLSDDSHYNGYLFHRSSRAISPMGETYAAYTAALSDTRYADLTVNVVAPVTETLENIPLGDPYETTSTVLPIWAYVGNLGKLAVTNPVPLVTYLDRPVTHYLTAPARYTAESDPLLVTNIPLTAPRRYEFSAFRIAVDPAGTVNDPRPWNNVVTVTLPAIVDARPDLTVTLNSWEYRPGDVAGHGNLSVTLTVANAGIWPSPPASGSLTLSDGRGSLLFPAFRFPVPPLEFRETATVTRRLTLTEAGLYTLTVEVDDAQQVVEQDEENNRSAASLDLRPDLSARLPDWAVHLLGTARGTLRVTYTVANEGIAAALPTSDTLALGDTFETLLLPVIRRPTPALWPGETLSRSCLITLPQPTGDFYRLTLKADGDGLLDESDEENNEAHLVVPVVVTTTLEPGVATVLTSTGGNLVFFIPTDTVTAPAVLALFPLWPADLPPGLWQVATAFSLTLYREGHSVIEPFLTPLTVTWCYTDSDVEEMDETALHLFHRTDAWRQNDGVERPIPEENRFLASIPEPGTYAFGRQRKCYLPLALRNNGGETP